MSVIPETVATEPAPQAPVSGDWVLNIVLDGRPGLRVQGGSVSTRGPFQAFVAGLLFDREDLKGRAGDSGGSDADLILAAYERLGDALFPTLRGRFVVAVSDQRRDRTIVVRDPLGAHPLFFARVGTQVHFAAFPGPLLARPGVSRALNGPAIADHLCHRWPDYHETFFAAIRSVPPGCCCIASGGVLRETRYWESALTDGPIEYLTAREEARFGELLDQAVRRCLDVGPAGIFLSGGLDSVSIAASASDHQRRQGGLPPTGLSLAFPTGECDEQSVQVGVARSLGLPYDMVPFWDAVGPRGLLPAGLELSASLPFPLFNMWAPAYLELARRGRQDGVRVVMTGSGGDEWLGVSPFLAADHFLRGNLVGLVRLAAEWTRSYGERRSRVFQRIAFTYIARPIASMVMQRVAPEVWMQRRVRRALNADPVWVAPGAEIRKALRARAPRSLKQADPRGGFYARESRETLDHPLISRELEEQFEFGRRLGMHFMHPYWDADLTSLIARTRPETRLRGGRAKAPAREWVQKRLPDFGFGKQVKTSAVSFFKSIVSNEWPRVAPVVGEFPALTALDVIDGRSARRFVEDEICNGGSFMLRCGDLFCVEMWARSQLSSSVGDQGR